MKIHRNITRPAQGFTLAEVAIATGIAAGVLAILSMVMGALNNDVRRLKAYEAWKRPAFVNSKESASSNTSNTNTDTPTSTTPTTPTVPLPDANLDPNQRPDANKPPPDPDDPATNPPTNPAGSAGGSTGSTTGSPSP